ncbi:MAG: amino acid ABC transporter permease [Candidatus Accumulibacter sp.]|jgi:polar amino acid transport system permease protein|nr:amino acid ABC transporter permease [Accumulibacter sp.]
MELDFPNMMASIPLFVRAAWTTLWIAACGIVLAGAIGLGCAACLYLKLPFVGRPIRAYIEVSRNTPLLVQLFLLHFGMKVEALPCAVIALAFLGGGYMAEAFRAGLEAVERSQVESALSLGLSRYEMVRYVVFPQALISAVPALGANVIFLLKETSVVSVVAVTDIVAVAKDLISLYYETAEALIMLVVTYLILLTPICAAVWWLERKVKYAVFGR